LPQVSENRGVKVLFSSVSPLPLCFEINNFDYISFTRGEKVSIIFVERKDLPAFGGDYGYSEAENISDLL
jgi:hypothetical protein